jgi:hypothetical protein
MVGYVLPDRYNGVGGAGPRRRRAAVAKGQMKSNKEARKPKKAKVKTIAANASQKGGHGGLEHLKTD